MNGNERRGGEADSVRLLELARRELLDALLPQLDGDARYRARLIAKAMQLAMSELHDDAAEQDRLARQLRDLAAVLVPAAVGPDSLPGPAAAALAAAIRTGRTDGQGALHDLLCRLTEGRRAALR